MSSDVDSSSVKTGGKGEGGGGSDAGVSKAPTASWSGKKEDLPGTPTPERPSNTPSPGSAASDDTCSICLGHIIDKCVADSCLHSFCLVCLKEWSKQKAVCPLCKLSFTKIMYEIKSESKYKEWIVPVPEPVERSQGMANFQEYLYAETRRFFGYRTTHYPGAAALRRYHVSRSHSIPDAIPSLPPQRRPRYNLRGSPMFRLSVYLNNIWVQPLADITGRYRQTSPQLYREQPALTHRLVPWVNRELAALISPSRVGVVLTEVMDLIERYRINSREFRNTMEQHLDRRTRHFVHEFYHFARSPYDMVGHDNAAQYVPRYEVEETSDTAISDDDSDAVVEVDSTGNPIASTSNADGSRNQSAPGNVAREETLTQEGSVVISSSESSDVESERSHSHNAEDFELTHNPEPPMAAMRRLLGRAVNFLGEVNEGASTSRLAGMSIRNLNNNLSREESEREDSEGCIIVEEFVPKSETPELIEIESDEEEENGLTSSQRDNSEVLLKSAKILGKSKPKLKRNNFVKSADDAKKDATGDSNIVQDHSYCSEDGPGGALPSTSSASDLRESCDTQVSGNQEDSQEGNNESDPSLSDESDWKEYRIIPEDNKSRSFRGKSRSSKGVKRKYNIDSSTSSGSSKTRNLKQTSDIDQSVRLPRKDLKSKTKNNIDSSTSSGSFKSKNLKQKSDKDRSVKLSRKDLKFKVKNNLLVESSPESGSFKPRNLKQTSDKDRSVKISKNDLKFKVKNSILLDSSPESGSFKPRNLKQTSDKDQSVRLPRKDLKSKIKNSRYASPSVHSVHTERRAHIGNHLQRMKRDSSCDSSGDMWEPPTKKARSSSTTQHRQHDSYISSSTTQHRLQGDCTSSEESCYEQRSSHLYRSRRYEKISKKSKKHKRSKEKHKEHKEKVKRSSKKRKHKRKSSSKSKKHESRHGPDIEGTERKKHRGKSGHKRKHGESVSSDSESSSYVKYRETTFKVRIRKSTSSSDSSDS